jgi:hypothetical protein
MLLVPHQERTEPMRYTRPTLVAAAVLLFAFAGGAASAQAAEQVPFTITEHIDFAAQTFTFTSTGPLCPSGTVEDTVATVAGGHSGQPKIELLITTVYTCDDNSGTFDMLKHVFITFNPDGSFTNTGPVQILGGTGAYAGLIGHGVDNGATSGDTGFGQITGFVILGS